MNRIALKKQLAALLLGFGLIMGQGQVHAEAAGDECTKELLLAYFPENFVVVTLKKFNVPQDKWEAITKGLAAKDKDVLKIVEDKASKLNPNPFKDRDPAQRQVAVKIFRETLLQVFSEVLKAQGVMDDKQLQSMLDDIQQQKAKNFAQCMEKGRAQIPAPGQKPAGSESQPATPGGASSK